MIGRSALVRALFVALAGTATSGALAACGSSDATTPSELARTDTTETAATVSDDPFCQQIKAASEQFGFGSGDTTDLAASMAKLPDAAALLEQASATAPAELQGDVTVLASTLASVAPEMAKITELTAMAASDPSKVEELTAASAAFKEKIAALQDPAFVAAFDHLNTYSKANCGISFS